MRRAALAILMMLALAACAPLVQRAGRPDTAFQGPRLEQTAFVSFDGARLGLQHWEPAGEPWAVIVGLHGMNDYSNAFHLAAPWWAQQGIATYAYDQRGLMITPRRVWATVHRAALLRNGWCDHPHTAGDSSTSRSAAGGRSEAKASMATAPPMLTPATTMIALG